jgi:hypothetical protein
MNRNDDLDRTIVIKPAKKTHGESNVPRLQPLLTSKADPKNPEEARRHLAVLASFYRKLRG